MNAIEFIKSKVNERGITISELARRTKIQRVSLYNSIGPNPSRTLRPDELVNLMSFLEITGADLLEARKYENTNEQNQSA